MRVGLFSPLVLGIATPAYVAALGQQAEERGFDSIWVAEPHVVLLDDYESRYPYSQRPDGKIVELRDEPDAFVTLGYLAAVTRRIRLGTGICVVPQRNPLYTAKEVTTLDHLSNGRLDFGVGIGWLKEEFAALGVPWEHRAERCRVYIEIMQSLWRDPVTSSGNQFYRLHAARQDIKPLQRPHPPIHFGGESDRALERVADLGQGWYGFNLRPYQAAERIQRLEQMLTTRGRTRTEIDVSVSPFLHAVNPETLEAYAEAGVDQIIIFVRIDSPDEIGHRLDEVAARVIEPAKRLHPTTGRTLR